MKCSIVIGFLLLCVSLSAQTNAGVEKSLMLQASWKFAGAEVFGQLALPEKEQQSDRLQCTQEGKYTWVYNGNATQGLWMLDKAGVWLTLTPSNGAVVKMRILELTPQKLKVDFKDADEIHYILVYGK